MGIQNQDAITAFFAGKGLTAPQIAGIEGNLQVESGGNPGAYNPGENAHGIAQWEGGRWSGPQGLQAFAASSGGSTGDLTTQLNFYWQELQTTERGALSALLAATTPADAATAIQSQYERSSTDSLPTRIANAQAIFSGGIQGGSGNVDGGGGVTAQPAGLTSAIWDGMLSALAPLGRLIVDGFVIILGAVFLVVAVVLLAKSSESNGNGGGSSSSSSPVGAGRRTRAQRTRSDLTEHGEGGGEGGGAAEAAEAVAA